jgi:signal transduction histidine kinase
MQRVLAWGVAALVVALGAAAVIFDALSGDHAAPWWRDLVAGAAILAPTAVGLAIAVKRPGNRIAWLLLADGAVLALAGATDGYTKHAILAGHGDPGARWAVLWGDASWPLLFAGVTAIAFAFPDGRLPSERWRRPAIATAIAFAALEVSLFLDPGPFASPYQDVASPLPSVPGAEWLIPPAGLGVLAGMVAAVRAVRARLHAADGVERRQLLWLGYAAALIPAAVLVCVAEELVSAGTGDATFAALLLTEAAIPVAVGIAVLRHRLYDIERIIDRTLVYGVLTALLAGAYAATALTLGVALGSRSAWSTAGATLAVALVFRPLRARVQRAVDRRFHRPRYEALLHVEGFLAELREGRAAPEGVEATIARAVGDAGLSLWFWLPESGIYADRDGRPVTDDPGDARARTPVTRAGVPIALVRHAVAATALDAVVSAAGLAIEIARLRVEVRRQLAEVDASRARLVSAGYAERRRLERDLHDGAQQRLVSIGLALRHVQHQLGPGQAEIDAELDGTVAEVGRAIEELRDLARGLRPSLLDDGLAPALKDLAMRAPVPVSVVATPARFATGLEAAAYFVACEAFTNAVKHAAASRVSVQAQRTEGHLVVAVSDNGVGGARAQDGSGLAGLEDRVHAHGGRLTIVSTPGEGTHVRAELPCGS